MAPPPNTRTLSLCCLLSVLLLFMHVHSSRAREMKVPEELLKQNEASPVSKEDDPYTSGYKAAYTFRKHIHPSQDEATHDSSQPYLAGYKNSQKDQKEIGKPYITAYGNSKRENQPYITQYENSKRLSEPYITAYKNSQKDQKEMGKLYITAYGNSKRVNQPYITAYSNSKRVNQPYITQYGNSNGKDSKDSYVATYRKESKDTYAATYKADHTEAFKTGFFTLDDLYVGNRMTLQFPIEHFPHFLSRKEAESIPFSMSQLPSVLQLFSIPEDSAEAQAMRDTLTQCEFEPLTGETKVCVSSLESMIDFVRAIISSDFHLDILTSTLPTTSSVPLQNFTVLKISQDIYAPKWVACHPLPYPYAVFYCHFISTGSKIFKVQLGSENGEQMEALGICHLDTSEWSPDHILFKQLGIKPGEAPVCHFFPVKHLMWVPLASKATM